MDKMICFKFRLHVVQWRDFRLPVSSFATAARKSFNGKFTAKMDLPIGFYVTITDADIRTLQTFIFDKYLYRMLVKFDQNRMVQICKIFTFLAKHFGDVYVT